MPNEYEKKNEPTQGQKDDKSMGSRPGQNPQGEPGREGERGREGQIPQQKKPSTPESGRE